MTTAFDGAHYPEPLQDFSVAKHLGGDYTFDKIFTRVVVDKQFDRYYKYDSRQHKRALDTLRVDGTESKGTRWTRSLDQFALDIHALHEDVLDSDIDNADDELNLKQGATESITDTLLTNAEIRLYDKILVPGLWAGEVEGSTDGYWNSDAVNPFETVDQQIVLFKRRTGGLRPNTLVLGEDAWLGLKHNPFVIDVIRHSDKAIVTEDLVAAMFGFDRLVVPTAQQNLSPETSQGIDVEPEMQEIFDPKSALMLYTAPTAGQKVQTAGVTFSWSKRSGGRGADAGLGARIKEIRMEHLNATRIEAEMAYDFKVIDENCGTFFTGIVE